LDWHVSTALAAVMGNSYNDESERMDVVRPIIASLLSIDIDGMDYGSTDWTVRLGESMILNLAIKNEKGTGGADAYMENVAYYVHFYAERGGPVRHCCPSLHVEVVGQQIGISGAVWNQFPTIQPLSDSVSFLNATQDNRLRWRQARLISAIRIGFELLTKYIIARFTP
jgi:hypothetical protein